MTKKTDGMEATLRKLIDDGKFEDYRTKRKLWPGADSVAGKLVELLDAGKYHPNAPRFPVLAEMPLDLRVSLRRLNGEIGG